MELKSKKCIPCEGGTPPLKEEQEFQLLKEIPTWRLSHEGVHTLVKVFTFQDFKEAMEFVNNVARIAEEQRHHPKIIVSYNKVTLELWTHKIKGLSENDFILAAKIETLSP